MREKRATRWAGRRHGRRPALAHSIVCARLPAAVGRALDALASQLCSRTALGRVRCGLWRVVKGAVRGAAAAPAAQPASRRPLRPPARPTVTPVAPPSFPPSLLLSPPFQTPTLNGRRTIDGGRPGRDRLLPRERQRHRPGPSSSQSLRELPEEGTPAPISSPRGSQSTLQRPGGHWSTRETGEVHGLLSSEQRQLRRRASTASWAGLSLTSAGRHLVLPLLPPSPPCRKTLREPCSLTPLPLCRRPVSLRRSSPSPSVECSSSRPSSSPSWPTRATRPRRRRPASRRSSPSPSSLPSLSPSTDTPPRGIQRPHPRPACAIPRRPPLPRVRPRRLPRLRARSVKHDQGDGLLCGRDDECDP